MLVQAAIFQANKQILGFVYELPCCHLEQTTTITVVDVPLGQSNNSVINIVNVSKEKYASLF